MVTCRSKLSVGANFSFISLGCFKAFMLREKHINCQMVNWFSPYFPLKNRFLLVLVFLKKRKKDLIPISS